jgi:predicted N-acyltransferase
MNDLTIDVIDSLTGIDATQWNRLAGGDPLLSHAFLSALHETGCASSRTGWTPQFIVLRRNGALAGALPLYLKPHSWGEYVFDWAWADAYHRHGLDYYPKLVAAVPFTPVAGARLLAPTPQLKVLLVRAALRLAQELEVSSLHVLLPDADDAAVLSDEGLLIRHGVQFHWHNPGYKSFDDYLAGMNHDKRKKIRQERRKVKDAGITFERIEGDAIRDEHWRFFFRCYSDTYRQHGSSPYLSLRFFRRLGTILPDQVLLIVASRAGVPIAAALNIRAPQRLCGRYWGTLEYHPALHFETCYYQAIEYCITQRIATFEGGAQGEHKIARGLLPVETRSAHWLAHPEFSAAIEQYLARETIGMSGYMDELNERSPFKAAGIAGCAEPVGKSD